ncbi:hypothetical protein QR680_012690 [Steinernema hermaphroditum]|uniref:Uncharacterized protein n=1 Tax=Steinernema hermaphroditum TaxID=289476 RepID=A0AA39I2U1_9BILA|nr:hypothetical protein QR680_012690 [Steinernema hermaphroditum]
MRQAKFVLVALLLLCAHGLAQSTPVIGGACKLGSADVQIGGKQTQFFLKCEAQPDSEEGSGVWTVKSRAAAPEALQAAQHHPKNVAPKQLHSAANICEQDVSARESAVCAVSETCLQQNPADASSYLQCEQTTKVWLKKACQDGAGFSFETQQCSGQAKRTHQCSACPVGTGCLSRSHLCIPLPESHLCSDRSAPQGVCPCAAGYVCTAQNLCCRRTNAFCPPHERCERVCPPNRFCSPLTRCCRPLRRPGDASRGTKTSRGSRPFLGTDYGSFDEEHLEKIASKIFKKIVSPVRTSTWLTPTTTTMATTTVLTRVFKECNRNLQRCLAETGICPRNHHCIQGCCELQRCPATGVLARKLPACASVYQCPKNSECLSGRCCLTTISSTTALVSMTPTTTSLILADSHDAYETLLLGTTSSVDEFLKATPCRLDLLALSTTCSLSEPCPEDSECLDGKCCLLPDTPKCINGLFALHLPESCTHNDDCPLGSLCEKRRCCPLEEDAPRTTVPPTTSPLVPSQTTVTPAATTTAENATKSVYESRLCPNGAESLSTPAHCQKCEDCPEGYDCRRGLCCTLDVLDYGSQGEPHTVININYESQLEEKRTTVGPTTTALSTTALDYEEVVLGSSNDTLSEVIDLKPPSELPITVLATVTPIARAATFPLIRIKKLRVGAVPSQTLDEKENCLGELCRMKITEGNKACPGGKCRIPAPIVRSEPEDCSEEYCRRCGALCARKICCFRALALFDEPTLHADTDQEECLAESVASCAGGLPCPVGFTCAQDGRQCCRVSERCPDGKVPDRLCSAEGLCPSSEELCVVLGQRAACCQRDYCIPQSICASDLLCPPTFSCQFARRLCCRRYPVGGGLVCTFSSCSASNPCQQGNCNNGYCCHSGSVAPVPIVESANTMQNPKGREAKALEPTADWPVGPPGLGFPVELTTLDQVLVRASGDGISCAAGFQSPLRCSALGACPPGLFCDAAVQRCCPLLLPLTDSSNPRPPTAPSVKRQQQRFSTIQASAGLAPQIVTIPSYQPQGCAVGCPRGFSGCCGTQQASCCQRQMCPGGVAPTGRSCYTSCPSGQLCVAGVCCPQANTGVQLTCPGGSQPYGMCQNGYCAQGYQCVQSTGMCCAVVQQSYSCPGGSLSVGQCINGQCGNGYSCNSQSNLCCQASTRNPFVCPDGTQAAGACVNGQCGGNFKCSNGLCCAHTATTPRCLDGTEAVGACMNGRCGDGYACTVGNICCIANLVEACPAGHEALGPCVGGLCPAVSQCVGGQCCAATGGIPGAFMCVDPTDAIAPCDDDAGCPAGYKCDTSEGGPGSCCPNPVQDPTPDNELLECQAGQMENECPDNYACVGGQNGKCRLVNPCVVDSVGPCIGAAGCPQGNTCNNGFCCPAARVHRAPVLPPAFRVYRPSIGSCPGGAAAVGGCFNGACGSGFSCLSGVCCPSSALQYSPGRACPNGMPAVGGCFDGAVCGVGYVCDVISNMCCSVAAAQTNNYNRCADGSAPLGSCPTGMDTCPRGYRCRGTICCRASLLSSEVFVGGRCQRDQECAGSAARLTLCVAGICRCEPLGFSTAPFPCVRRSYHFRLNDSPIPEDSNATVSSATTAAPEASTATKSS